MIQKLYRPLIITLIVSVLVGLGWPSLLVGNYSIGTAIGVTLALWLAIATVVDFGKKVVCLWRGDDHSRSC